MMLRTMEKFSRTRGRGGAPDSCGPRPALRRVLGVTDGAAIVIGISIGVGIYTTPRIIAGYLDYFPLVITLWLAVGLVTLIGSFVYAELGTRLPETGGEYLYIRSALDPFAGFMLGWAQFIIVHTGSTAGVTLIAAEYLGYFVRLSPGGQAAAAVAIIACLGMVNWLGIKRASILQKSLAVLKVAGIAVLILSGLVLFRGYATGGGTSPAASGAVAAGNLVRAVMMIFFTYGGWTRVGYVAGEIRNPGRVIPASLLLGVGTVITANVLANVAYFRVLGMEGMARSTMLASDLALSTMGPAGAGLVAAFVILSALGTANGIVMSAPRGYYAMARDGSLPRWLDDVSPRFRTPARAIVAHCCWSGVLILARGKFETIVAGRVFGRLLSYTVSTIALLRLRKSKAGEGKAWRMPWHRFLPVFFLVCVLLFIAFRCAVAWRESLVDLALIASGLPFWLFHFRRTAERGRAQSAPGGRPAPDDQPDRPNH